MIHSENLNQQLNQLATEVCQHPKGSLKCQRLLNQLIYQMQQSGKIWKGNDIREQYYEDALQQTWFWFCKNIHNYDASQANVITWFNVHLKYRLLDVRREIAEEEKTKATNLKYEESNPIDPIDNLPAPDKPQPILEETLEWIETQGSELRRLHVRSFPHINCQELLKSKLPPDAKTWRELAEKFGKRESTLNHFYHHKCFPCLLAFGRAQGYIDT
ncbi:sigma-70 family RNA polymerase sigma factor [Rivularia sp. UHCC 0363]|uniref:sigma-70 family RNA polymerase sigma factor n=1 Tax=Rivularia sp. UHCC 0363 TaxID=3110244 RepID=UPI002B21B593|nr:sigma-70 family RNA polymerase sigma factor [Rivularia sp. UHCC 0363]MEA5598395.1 sigma-70 family RNA polymerase sigma factor [Rivularia sp. UHCC 0363]